MVAEATGRSEEDVMADLLDDGVVNFSNRKEEKNLVEQLKEAAELITTVQAINKEVAGNTVLNGGKNKTEVAVETTLEGDIVDRAIESIQRKSERIKKLLVTLTPLLLIITGGSLDALGIIELTGDESDDDDHYDPSWDMVWGCTAWDADNYDAMATEDDGSCYWDDGPDEIWGCMDSNADNFNPDANRDDGSCYYEPDPCENLQVIQTQDPEFRTIGDSNNAEVIFYLKHNKGPECDGTVFVEVMISLFYNDAFQNTLEFGQGGSHSVTGNPQSQFEVRDGMFNGLGEGSWKVETRWKLGNGLENCCVMSDSIEISEPEPEPVYGCTDIEADNYNDEATDDDGSCEYPPEPDCDAEVHNHYRGHENNDPNSTTMIVAFYLEPDESCGTVEWQIELYQAGYAANYTRSGSVSGGAESISQTFNDMAPGTWIPRITLEHEGVQVEQVHFWSLDIVEPEPTPCEINLYDIAFGTNSTHASVAYDIDCGYGSEVGGFNVSVQFLVYDVNGTSTGNGSGPITFETDLHYIEGYVEDVHTLTLTNFTSSNATNYDFYWYAIWIDADGEQQLIEIKWLNRELNE